MSKAWWACLISTLLDLFRCSLSSKNETVKKVMTQTNKFAKLIYPRKVLQLQMLMIPIANSCLPVLKMTLCNPVYITDISYLLSLTLCCSTNRFTTCSCISHWLTSHHLIQKGVHIAFELKLWTSSGSNTDRSQIVLQLATHRMERGLELLSGNETTCWSVKDWQQQ